MRALGRIASAVALVACVPAAAETDPRGGVAISFLGTDATNGKPFLTDDGWTVTVDAFAVRAYAQGQNFNGGGGTSRARIINASPSCTLRVSAMNLGPAGVEMSLNPSYLYEGEPGGFLANDEPPCAIDPTTYARFNHSADNDQYAQYAEQGFTQSEGPSLVLRAHAEKAGRLMRLELALAVSQYAFGYNSSKTFESAVVEVDIQANKGSPARFVLDAAQLLRDTEGSLQFDRMAQSDANGDGLVTGPELLAKDRKCDSSDPSSDGYDPTGHYQYGCTSLGQDIAENHSQVFSPVAP